MSDNNWKAEDAIEPVGVVPQAIGDVDELPEAASEGQAEPRPTGNLTSP